MFKQKKIEMIVLIEVILFLVITFFLFAPLELFLTNQIDFWFTLHDFVGIPIIVSLIATVVFMVIGSFLNGRVLTNYVAMIFSLGLGSYIQGNFLNISVGVMNGAAIDWSVYNTNYIINITIWILCIVVVLLLANKKSKLMKKIMGYVSIMLSSMQLVTLVVLILTASKPEKADKSMFVSDKNLYNVSSEGNIIVFCPDMFDDRYFQKILEQEPGIAEELDGFTYFTNSVGVYNTTNYSVAMLLTGEYLYNQEPYADQYNTAFEKSAMMKTLWENEYITGVYEGVGLLPSKMLPGLDNYIEGKIVISDKVEFAKELYSLVACKYLPNVIKQYLWLDGSEFENLKEIRASRYNSCSYDNVVFYENLKKQGLEADLENKAFKFIHLDGAHYPYYNDEYGNRVEEEQTSDVQAARGVLRMIQEYIEQLKAKGVYDQTAIVIVADHGYYWDGVITNPVLLVKPMNSTGPMLKNNAPVSSVDFQATVLSLAGLNGDGQYGKSYFDYKEGEERERLFYQYYLQEGHVNWNFRLIEYVNDGEDNKRENFHLTNVEYSPTGEKTTHKDKCVFCLSGEEVPLETQENWPVEIVHEPVEE